METREIIKCTCETLEHAFQIYKNAGRDFSFATKAQLQSIMEDGAIYLCKNGDEYTAVGGIILAQKKNHLCRAISKTGIAQLKEAQIILPIAGKIIYDVSFLLDNFISMTLGNHYVALCPIKCANIYLSHYFAQNMCITKSYPLYELRPYYLLEKNAFAFMRGSSIIMPYANTKAISKLLENGYKAVNYDEKKEEIKLVKETVR